MNERRKRPHVVCEFFARIAQSLNLRLGWRVGNGQASDLAVGITQCDGGLVRPCRLDYRGHTIEPNLVARHADNGLPRISAGVALQYPLRGVQECASLGAT